MLLLFSHFPDEKNRGSERKYLVSNASGRADFQIQVWVSEAQMLDTNLFSGPKVSALDEPGGSQRGGG